MKLRGVAKFVYEVPVDESGPFQGIHVDGKPDGAAGGRVTFCGGQITGLKATPS